MNNHGDKHGLKSKTIKSILRRKIDAWLETIDDEILRETCRKEAIVTGGCIASMLLGEEVNDFDIYFRTKATVKKVADYYLAKFAENKKAQGGVATPMFVEELNDMAGKDRVRIVVKSAGVSSVEQSSDYDYFEGRPDHDAGQYIAEAFDPLSAAKDFVDPIKEELANAQKIYSPSFLSSNAVSLRGQVQLILRFYGDPEEIHSSYDFSHCMNYWESGQSKLTLNADSLEALLSRTLVYRGSQYPLCSIIRTQKFIKRGWRINAGQYLKMAMQVSNLDLTDHRIREEQLTGVDVAYFAEVIAKIKDKDPQKVDAAYLVEIIDRMF